MECALLLCANFRYIVNKYDMNVKAVKMMENNICNHRSEDIRKAEQISELSNMRDKYGNHLFSKVECNDTINFLYTN